MLRSLRSLCLLTVSNLGLSNRDLPPELARDLNAMKVFNGNYTYTHDEFDDEIILSAVTIFFDGVSWSLSYRSESFVNCPCCNEGFRPTFREFTVTEGEPVKTTSPFPKIWYWLRSELGYMESSHKIMKMEVMVGQDGTFGRIVFSGARECFKSTMQVYFTMEGTRVLSHNTLVKGRIGGGLRGTLELHEATLPAKEAFKNYHNIDWSWDGEDECLQTGLMSSGK